MEINGSLLKSLITSLSAKSHRLYKTAYELYANEMNIVEVFVICSKVIEKCLFITVMLLKIPLVCKKKLSKHIGIKSRRAYR